MKQPKDINQKAIDRLNRKNKSNETKLTSGASLNIAPIPATTPVATQNPGQNGVLVNSDGDPGRTLGIISLIFSLSI